LGEKGSSEKRAGRRKEKKKGEGLSLVFWGGGGGVSFGKEVTGSTRRCKVSTGKGRGMEKLVNSIKWPMRKDGLRQRPSAKEGKKKTERLPSGKGIMYSENACIASKREGAEPSYQLVDSQKREGESATRKIARQNLRLRTEEKRENYRATFGIRRGKRGGKRPKRERVEASYSIRRIRKRKKK